MNGISGLLLYLFIYYIIIYMYSCTVIIIFYLSTRAGCSSLGKQFRVSKRTAERHGRSRTKDAIRVAYCRKSRFLPAGSMPEQVVLSLQDSFALQTRRNRAETALCSFGQQKTKNVQ